jgi:hypothetical protein
MYGYMRGASNLGCRCRQTHPRPTSSTLRRRLAVPAEWSGLSEPSLGHLITPCIRSGVNRGGVIPVYETGISVVNGAR